MTEPLDLEPIKARLEVESGEWPEPWAVQFLADHQALIAEVERLREMVAEMAPYYRVRSHIH